MQAEARPCAMCRVAPASMLICMDAVTGPPQSGQPVMSGLLRVAPQDEWAAKRGNGVRSASAALVGMPGCRGHRSGDSPYHRAGPSGGVDVRSMFSARLDHGLGHGGLLAQRADRLFRYLPSGCGHQRRLRPVAGHQLEGGGRCRSCRQADDRRSSPAGLAWAQSGAWSVAEPAQRRERGGRHDRGDGDDRHGAAVAVARLCRRPDGNCVRLVDDSAARCARGRADRKASAPAPH